MDEPTLRDSTDYNGLSGEKKRVVYGVVIGLLLIGLVYTIVKELNSHVSDEIKPGKIMDYSK